MRRIGGTAIALLLVLASCAPAVDSQPPSSETPSTTTFTVVMDEETITVSRPVGCAAEPGSPTDLSAEPGEWLAFGTYKRWSDAGCPVRIDVISHINGAQHCGWEKAEFITMAKTLGDPVTVVSEETTNRYVWNADGVIPSMEPGRTIDVAILPSTATETDYSRGDDRLWIDTDDVSVIYVVGGDTARVFVRDLQAGLCE